VAILPSSYPNGNGQQSDVVTLIHDAFQPLSYWNNFMPRENYVGVAIDTHIYQMFVDEVGFQYPSTHPINSILSVTLPSQTVSLDEAGHIQSACGNAGRLYEFNKNQLWTIVGEWTPAMTDCAKYLNGRGIGARYDGSIRSGAPYYGSCVGMTGKGSTFSQRYKVFLRKVWEAQVSPYIYMAYHSVSITVLMAMFEGHYVRESEWLDTVDLEGGTGGRMVIFSRTTVWLDSASPN
jgi:aryl-phospho-beta-D-glucosidase BglC (GH1 family)